ncbi:MAG: hypothetical protein A2516_06765 [Alphaproteobacteria bacterium RIFOXYD12_FULL_60_8]|nr:MAG: hypothetical protein A2516_06765 [Alphaproteobacteria bacterium RIFOXYD12_FULL_60_8]
MNLLKSTALAGFALCIATTARAEDLTFTLENATSQDIEMLQISTVASSSWEEDILGNDVQPAGTNATITIADGQSVCEYDILITFADNTTIEDHNVNLCDLGTYTAHE